jgi:hypothetical protein
MADEYRVLVTGSRDFLDPAPVWQVLDGLVTELHLLVGRLPKMTIVHGACLTGADHSAHLWVVDLGVPEIVEEPHPADWSPDPLNPSEIDRSAGPRRNRLMASLGAWVAVAFPIANRVSAGTWNCIRAAADASIPVRIYPQSVAEAANSRPNRR